MLLEAIGYHRSFINDISNTDIINNAISNTIQLTLNYISHSYNRGPNDNLNKKIQLRYGKRR